MRRLVIIGAGGFLGSAIIQEAKKLDLKIVAITSRPLEIKNTYGDICDTLETTKFLNGAYQMSGTDVIINCLFPTNANGYQMANGLEKVFRVITIAKESGAGTFINISSQSVYAPKREKAADEDETLCLETPYAVAKYSIEVFCDLVFQERPHTNIRLASLLGIGYDQRIVNRMVRQALEGKNLKVIGGMQRYGFLDVRDAAAGIVKMALSDFTNWKPIYNLGRSESYTLLDVVEIVVSEMKKRGLSVSYEILEGTDIRNSSINAERFMKDFMWKPAISLSQTIGNIIDEKMDKD